MNKLEGEAPAGVRDVLRLAWPTVLSFVCASAYRINDQYWIGDLGPDAQAALGASFFVLVLNFAIYFITVAGSLPLVARATGARDGAERDLAIRHAVALAGLTALIVGVCGTQLSSRIPEWLGLGSGAAGYSRDYLRMIYLGTLPMALAPLIDNIFIGMGHTRVPLLMQSVSVGLNFILNPCLIYGWGPFPELGMSGAALATVISRSVSVILGFSILRFAFDVHWLKSRRIQWQRLRRILSIGFAGSISIAVYSCVYIALYRTVLVHLGRDAKAGLGIGFNAFEGMSFPFFLGVAIAGSSLVGRNLGARAPELAHQAVASVRRVSLVFGLSFTLIFWFGAPYLVPIFTDDPAVLREAVLYVRVLAFSQVFVAIETANEKVLLGSGHSRPILWISGPLNILRIPLAWWLALHLGWGPLGVWWAINLTTVLKATAFHVMVTNGSWARMQVPST